MLTPEKDVPTPGAMEERMPRTSEFSDVLQGSRKGI